MNNILKFFPFMPGKNETGKLILAYALYKVALPLLIAPINSILALTIILAPIAMIISYALNIYIGIGLLLAVLHYIGHDFSTTNNP